jgi:hypothetical protein
MKIDGRCLCGHIRYEAEIDPAAVIICHCTDCQINSATAFRYGVLVKVADFRLISGELRRYIKTNDSGRQRALSFCPECGTSIHGGDVSDPQQLSLRLGGPRSAGWTRSAASKPSRPSPRVTASTPADLGKEAARGACFR